MNDACNDFHPDPDAARVDRPSRQPWSTPTARMIEKDALSAEAQRAIDEALHPVAKRGPAADCQPD